MRSDSRLFLLLLAITLVPAGCVSDPEPHDDINHQLNQQWLQGYGFNNPNVERRRRGLPPLNFDGSVHKEPSFLECLLEGLFSP